LFPWLFTAPKQLGIPWRNLAEHRQINPPMSHYPILIIHFKFCSLHPAHGRTPAQAAGLTEHQWTKKTFVSRLTFNPQSGKCLGNDGK
jgi:hypothetical protein